MIGGLKNMSKYREALHEVIKQLNEEISAINKEIENSPNYMEDDLISERCGVEAAIAIVRKVMKKTLDEEDYKFKESLMYVDIGGRIIRDSAEDNMITISLDEWLKTTNQVEKLKNENDILISKIDNLNEGFTKNLQNYEEKIQELANLGKKLNDENFELYLKNSILKQKLKRYGEKLDD